MPGQAQQQSAYHRQQEKRVGSKEQKSIVYLKVQLSLRVQCDRAQQLQQIGYKVGQAELAVLRADKFRQIVVSKLRHAAKPRKVIRHHAGGHHNGGQQRGQNPFQTAPLIKLPTQPTGQQQRVKGAAPHCQRHAEGRCGILHSVAALCKKQPPKSKPQRTDLRQEPHAIAG